MLWRRACRCHTPIKKMKFSVQHCKFGHIYWRNPSWKTQFFVQWRWARYRETLALSKLVSYRTVAPLKMESHDISFLVHVLQLAEYFFFENFEFVNIIRPTKRRSDEIFVCLFCYFVCWSMCPVVESFSRTVCRNFLIFFCIKLVC